MLDIVLIIRHGTFRNWCALHCTTRWLLFDNVSKSTVGKTPQGSWLQAEEYVRRNPDLPAMSDSQLWGHFVMHGEL